MFSFGFIKDYTRIQETEGNERCDCFLLFKNMIQFQKAIFKDRKLLLAFASKDLQRRFSGSMFGILWAFVQPLLTILIYWFAFEFGFRSGAVGETPYVLWFIAAIVPWLFISEAISFSSNCFIEYSYLVKKVVFNIDILPMVKIFSSLRIHGIFLVIVEIIYVILGVYPTLKIIQLIYYVLCAVVFVFAISLFFSSIMVFFRDINQLISSILLIGMWATPIAWNIELFPENIIKILSVNPVYYIVEGYRDALIGRAWFFEKEFETLRFWGITLVLLIFGVSFYNRLKPHFADTL